MSKWPRDNQSELIRFYGDPGTGAVGAQLIRVTPPFQMFYDGKPIKSVSFHKKAAAALLAALQKVWDYYDQDQDKINELGISNTAGTYNPRKVRGSATKWSNHAFGAAIDINAEENSMGTKGNMPKPMVAAFKSEGARWGGDYRGRTDPMHFEFCNSGEEEKTFEEWLDFYGVNKEEVAEGEPDDNASGIEFADVTETIKNVGKLAAPAMALVGTAAAATQQQSRPPLRSRINWGATALGGTSATTAIASNPETRSLFVQLIEQPTFWLAILCLVMAGYIIYHRWLDHGKKDQT
jgi:D-alanyl-D-alanine carboxypeptidase-like protein